MKYSLTEDLRRFLDVELSEFRLEILLLLIASLRASEVGPGVSEELWLLLGLGLVLSVSTRPRPFCRDSSATDDTYTNVKGIETVNNTKERNEKGV